MAHGHEDFDRGISIDAQEIAQVAVDIATQSLAEMNIDVVAQTIGHQDIDVDAQTIAEVIQRPKMGSFQGAGILDYSVVAGDSVELYNITGKGAIQSVLYGVQANTDSHLCEVSLQIDNNLLPSTMSFETLNARGAGPDSWPIRLTQYGVDSLCVAETVLNYATFENNTILTVNNPTGVQQVFVYAVSQQIL